VIPRGLRFRVELLESAARGYVCENFGAPFRLPDLGPIGSNGLANPRDFQTPVARYEDQEGEFELVAKSPATCGRRASTTRRSMWWRAWQQCALQVRPAALQHHRLHQLRSSRSVDFCSAAVAQRYAGVDAIDFVIFPPRWLAMEDTFRPPWFHRNVASEFMGLIEGVYDAKAEGFAPGGASLHNCMSGHGPDAATYDKAIAADTSRPVHITTPWPSCSRRAP